MGGYTVMIIRQAEAEEKGLLQVAELMCLAARTAPKGKGRDHLETLIITAETKTEVAAYMRKLADSPGAEFFARDAGNLEQAGAAVILGTQVKPLRLPHCGYCGFENCTEMDRAGGICAFNAGDLGIALGSAVAVAAAHHVDNRVMFTVGRAAIDLGLFSGNVRIAYGIPLSVSGKNPFFDRK